MSNPICCGQESKEVMLNRDTNYFFCEACRKEVEAKKELDFNIMPDDFPDHWGTYSKVETSITSSRLSFKEYAALPLSAWKSTTKPAFYSDEDAIRLINESNADLFAQQPIYIPQEEVNKAIHDLMVTINCFQFDNRMWDITNKWAAEQNNSSGWDDDYGCDDCGWSKDYAHLRDF